MRPGLLPHRLTLLALGAGACTVPQPDATFETDDVHLASDPIVTIGSAGGDYPLNQVSAAVVLPDGSIVVADGGRDARVTRFDGGGVAARLIGRQGDGPGEYSEIASVQVGAEGSVQHLGCRTPAPFGARSDGSLRG